MSDQEDCMLWIEPLWEALYGSLTDAMVIYQSEYAPVVLAQHRSRTAKGCVYDHAMHALRERLDGKAGCVFRNIRGFEVLIFKDLAVVRLKHVTESGRTKNYPTDQQRDYDDQVSFLPHVPDEAKRLVVGYEADAAFSAIDRIIVARPWGRAVLWTAQINKQDDSLTYADITPARIAGTEPFDMDAIRRRRRNQG